MHVISDVFFVAKLLVINPDADYRQSDVQCVCLCVHSFTMLLIDSCIWFSTEEEESLTVTQRDTALKGTSVSFLTLPLTSVCSLCSLNISIGSFVLED